MANMNSTSLKLRMSGSWRANRYLDNNSSRTSLEYHTNVNSNTHKMKTIMLNSEIIDLAEKDLQMQFSPKLSSKQALPTNLNLNKKQTDVLKKYLSRFK